MSRHPRVLAHILVCATVGAAPSVFMLNGAHAAAGPPQQPTAAQIQLALRKLGVVGSVLYVAAHPDDENTNLLAYLSNGALLQTGYLSITRGDGGQNLIGSEQGPELGLIRTQELLAARRIDGAEQFFTRARDFGYSKSPDETLRIWGKDAVLSDVVWVIRRFRPDVIITRFSPEPSDTHGHHTASAQLAAEAFRAAADPHAYPEQLAAGVGPWQARRLLWNRSTWSAKPGDDFSGFDRVDVGGYNPLAGQSYGEMAADSRSMHKSQGFGVARARGPIVEYFKTIASADPPAPQTATAAAKTGTETGTETGTKTAAKTGTETGWLNGMDLSWTRWPHMTALRTAIEAAQRTFNPAAPATSIAPLLAVDAALDGAPDSHWRAKKREEVRDLIVACAGLFLDATAADHRVAPGGSIDVTATAVNRSAVAVTLREVRFGGAGGDDDSLPVGRALVTPPGQSTAPVEVKRSVPVPPDFPLTTPYWLAAPPGAGLYAAAAPRLIGRPEDEPPFHADFVLDWGTRSWVVRRPIAFKWTDPVAGERYRALEVTPAVSIRPDAAVLLFPARDRRAQTLTVRLTAGAPSVSGVLRPTVPAGWTVEPRDTPFKIETKGQEIEVVLRIKSTSGGGAEPVTLHLIVETAGAGSGAAVKLSRGVVHIEHTHIPIQTWLADADVRLVPLALQTAGTKIGYIPGPGDEVPTSLRRVGYQVSMLTDEAVRAGPAGLSAFDAIVVGVRAFNTNERLRAAHDTLMKYVEGGGTLVVQYNTNSRLGPLSVPLGPFPFDIGRDRVTDQTAVVTFAQPDHPVLNLPNKVTARDFDGWIQERGLYFADKWDPRYHAPLSLHDPGEKPLEGALLVARHGKGTFVYTGLAFFRQLPAGVPGAFRLFANLVANRRGAHAR